MKREREYINKAYIGFPEMKNMIYEMKKYTEWELTGQTLQEDQQRTIKIATDIIQNEAQKEKEQEKE